MNIRRKFEEDIVKGITIPNNKGYVARYEDNLIPGIAIELFLSDLSEGSGNELESKFRAVYSSSALAVNNFALVKKHCSGFSFLGYSNFTAANFERKFRTGLKGTPPNLDFALESNNALIAFESKYLELLSPREVKFADSYNRVKLHYLNDDWFKLISRFKGRKMLLDAGQLIKHAIGLVNFNRNAPVAKEIMLVYIYWLPINNEMFPEYKNHLNELQEFETEFRKLANIRFISMPYIHFWDTYCDSSAIGEHLRKVKERYHIKITGDKVC